VAIRVKQVGRDFVIKGMDDVTLGAHLRSLRRTTFFTRDHDFFGSKWLHPNYCLVWLHMDKAEAASYIRRFPRHPHFNTKAKRMGTVVEVSPSGLKVWRLNHRRPEKIAWQS
jgi:hypothetical protein